MRDFKLSDISNEVRLTSNDIAYNSDNWVVEFTYEASCTSVLILGANDLQISISVYHGMMGQTFYNSSSLNSSEVYLLYKSAMVMIRGDKLRARMLKLNSMLESLHGHRHSN